MGASAAETPTQPDARPPAPAAGMRASDADRDEVVARLREEFAAGRLSQDTFLLRVNAVLAARHQADLPPLLADLPDAAGRPARPGRPGAAAPLNALLRRLRAARLRWAWPLHPRMAQPRRPPAPLEFPRSTGGSFSIGRGSDCDLAILDMTVSRVHARLERTPEGWLLTDLGSTNGTRVNGWRVRGEVRVRPGDLVSFGDAEYSLRAADGAQAYQLP